MYIKMRELQTNKLQIKNSGYRDYGSWYQTQSRALNLHGRSNWESGSASIGDR